LLFLLKLLFLPIWLPLKIIGDLIEHSGRSHRSHHTYSRSQSRSNGRGCLAVVLAVIVIAVIGAIADACSSGPQPAGHNLPAGSTVSISPTNSPSTASHHARHHRRRRHRHHRHHVAAVPVATSSAPPASSCHPLSNEGTCYEPGEFCRHSDEGATGVAGDGEAIKCEDNDGWRWEPV